MKEIRLLTADEVECRVQQVTAKNGAVLLLYKDARVDMRILDETFGPMNWQRHHGRDNANCVISVWDEVKNQWIEKEDTGTESQTEAAKGLASDSFKRAGFNWGIGRELYDAPFIFVPLAEIEVTKNSKGKNTTYTKFSVVEMEYSRELRAFTKLKIVDNKGTVRFDLGKQNKSQRAASEPPASINQGKPTASPINITSVSENGAVRFINGVQCQIQDRNGDWHDIEFLKIEVLEKLLNDDKYVNAHEAIRAAINAKAAGQK